MRSLLVAGLMLCAATAGAQVPGTDLYRMQLVDSVPVGPVRNLTARAGYDNQPAFVPGSAVLRYTAMDAQGRADIFALDLNGGAPRRLTGAEASEYSPLQIPGSDRFSVVRVEADSTQRVWSFAADGSEPRVLLADRTGVGYHAWFDSTELLLFVLADPPELHRARTDRPGSVRVASGVGRCLQRIPGEAAWSFVRADAGDRWTICRLDAASGEISVVAPPPAPGVQDHCWTPDGRLWSTDGARILEWVEGTPGRWEAIAVPEGLPVDGITRMAVSENFLVFVAPDPGP